MLRPAVVVSEQSGAIRTQWNTTFTRTFVLWLLCFQSGSIFWPNQNRNACLLKTQTGTVLRMSTDGVSRKGSPHAFLDQTEGMHFEHFLNGKFEELRKTFSFWFSGQASLFLVNGSLRKACKFFANKWEFEQMGFWRSILWHSLPKWDPICSRMYCTLENQ